jgi:hypothetical protein
VRTHVSGRLDAVVGATVLVLAFKAVLDAAAGSYVGALFALAGVVLLAVPVVVAPEESGTVLPNRVVPALLAAPALAAWLGLPDPVAQGATYLAVGAFGFVATAELTALTDVELPPRVAGPFTVFVTLAAAGLWTVVRWGSDVLLGTALLAGKTAANLDLLAAAVVAVAAGALFTWTAARTDDGGPSRSGEVPRRERSSFQRPVDDRERLLVRVLQAVLAVLTVGSLLWGRFDVFVNGALSLAVTFLPGHLRRDHSVTLNPALTLLIVVAVLVHTVGIAGPYRSVPFYDSVAHAISASVVTLVGFTAVRSLDLHAEDVAIPEELLVVTVVLFAVAFGVVWELLEFGTNVVAAALGIPPQLLQHGVSDIALDILFDALAGLVVGYVAVRWWPTVADGVGRLLPGSGADDGQDA